MLCCEIFTIDLWISLISCSQRGLYSVEHFPDVLCLFVLATGSSSAGAQVYTMMHDAEKVPNKCLPVNKFRTQLRAVDNSLYYRLKVYTKEARLSVRLPSFHPLIVPDAFWSINFGTKMKHKILKVNLNEVISVLSGKDWNQKSVDLKFENRMSLKCIGLMIKWPVWCFVESITTFSRNWKFVFLTTRVIGLRTC